MNRVTMDDDQDTYALILLPRLSQTRRGFVIPGAAMATKQRDLAAIDRDCRAVSEQLRRAEERFDYEEAVGASARLDALLDERQALEAAQ